MNQNHYGVLHLTQRVLDMLQAQSPPKERHEGQFQGLEAEGQDPDVELDEKYFFSFLWNKISVLEP